MKKTRCSMKTRRASKQPDFLAALIRTAYLPEEIPPVVTSRYFSSFCRSEYSYLKTQQKSLIKSSTNYDTFTAPRPVGGRRNLALVHPLAQLGISLLITQHRSRIKKIISKTKTSLYRTNEDMAHSKAFAGLDFRSWDARALQLYSESKFVLKADISRFFYTAYTHSIPWAVLGKERVKEWLIHNKSKLNAHWSSDFDTALQSCQSRETFGIPVGPDTSRVIAEILVAGVEADKNYASLVKDRPRIRLLDDFIVGFDDENEAQKARTALRRALWGFNLQLNEEKTSVSQSRMFFRDKWKLEFEAIRISDSDDAKQEHDIYRLIDLTLHLCSVYGTNAPAHWACVRFSGLKRVSRNFRIIFDAMLRFARDFPSCTHHVAAFLINNQSRCNDPYLRNRIDMWIRGTVRNYFQHSYDFEVAWCLLVSGVFQITIHEKDLISFEPMPNSVNFAILGMLRERGLLSVPLSRWAWRSVFKKNGIYGENWLPFYEAVRRKWTKDKAIISAVTGDPILNKMLTAEVTFLEDHVFDATKIDVRRRVFRRSRRYKLSQAEYPQHKEEAEEEDKSHELSSSRMVIGDYGL